MINMKRAGQILMGIILVASVASLYGLYDPIHTLANLVKKSPILNRIIIHSKGYYYVMLLFFLISGNCAIANIKIGIYFQGIGSLMLALTFENFLLYDSKEDKMIKGLHILCHIVFFAALRESYKQGHKETSKTTRKLKSD